MKLSKRLETVVSFAGREQGRGEPGRLKAGEAGPRRIADVGTDHGFVPIALALRDPEVTAIAMDVRPGPLGRAKEHIEACGLEERVKTRLGDGVEKLKEGEADTVVIAGMGGELVIHILEGGRRLWGTVERWILSPQSELDKVRRYLDSQGFAIVDEAMVEEDGKYYTVMEVTGPGSLQETAASGKQEDEALLKAGYLYGPRLIEKKDPVLLRFLEREEGQLTDLIDRLECGKSPRTAHRLGELRERRLLARRAMEAMSGGAVFWSIEGKEEDAYEMQ